MAMVALPEAALPGADTVLGALTADWDDLPAMGDVEDGGAIVSLRVHGGKAGWITVPGPIPWSELEGPCRAAWHWPEAEAALRGHAAHAVVHAGSNDLDGVGLALLVTKLSATLVRLGGAAGVYWGSAGVVHAPGAFVEQAKGACRAELPVPLWVGFHPLRDDDGGVTVLTTGMEAFGDMEVEATTRDRRPSELVGMVADFVHHLLLTGAPVADGDTIGASGAERIQVRHHASRRHGAPVYAFTC